MNKKMNKRTNKKIAATATCFILSFIGLIYTLFLISTPPAGSLLLILFSNTFSVTALILLMAYWPDANNTIDTILGEDPYAHKKI